MLEVGQTSTGIRVLGQMIKQALVLDCGGAVADSFRPELVQCVPDRLRSGGLTGVRHAVQPGGAGLVEVGLELRPRHPDLRPAESEPDQSSRTMIKSDRQRAFGAPARPGSPGMSKIQRNSIR